MIEVTTADLNTSANVWKHIKMIASVSGRKEKINLLEDIWKTSNTLFPWTMKMVFDNTINFGIVIKADEWAKYDGNFDGRSFGVDTIHFLLKLKIGDYTRTEALYQFGRVAEPLDPDSLRLLVGIINKDISAGINTSTVNKVFKSLIPTFPYMRCSLPTDADLNKFEWDVGVYAQEKADGMFVNINVTGDVVTLMSRQGTIIPIEKFGEAAKHLHLVLPFGNQIHGEIIVKDPDGRVAPREIGNGMINSVCKGGDFPLGWTPLFRVWDCIPLAAVQSKGKYTSPYRKRFEALREYIKTAIFRYKTKEGIDIKCVEPIETRIVHSREDAMAFYRYMVTQGKEGAVIKNPSAIWRDGTSREQIKLKLECDCDLKIVGYDEGEGKFKGTLGSLICETSDGLLRTNISGFNDETRNAIWKNREYYLDKVITVRFNDVMQKEGQPASLFLPRFVEFRDDKIEADSLNRVIYSKNKAIA